MQHVSQIFNFKSLPCPRHVFEIFNFKEFAMLCRTFSSFLTLKVLSCPLTISSLYKFIDMFARLSTSLGKKGGGGGVLLGLASAFRFRLGLGLGDRVRISFRIGLRLVLKPVAGY